MDISTTLNNLVFALQPSDPYRIILFGSYANGNPHKDSDIDLLVVLDSEHISKTYEERLNQKTFIRNLVLEINRKFPLDILVYSKAELHKLKEYGNYFIAEIEKTGKIIYEKTNQRLALVG